jgi:hypothetical protein
MKKFFLLIVMTAGLKGFAQTEEAKLISTLKEFHQSLVNGNTVSINQHTDRALSYGHSNGWIETKNELVKNLETGYMDYYSYKEDSLQVEISGFMAHARFVADIHVTLNGKDGTYHLKVLEVWVKKGKRWLLFARQAVRG